MESFKPILSSMGLTYKKNRMKKVWTKLSEDDRKKINNGDLSGAKSAVAMVIMGEPWSEDEEYQSRWRYHTNQTKKEFEDLCDELSLLV